MLVVSLIVLCLFLFLFWRNNSTRNIRRFSRVTDCVIQRNWGDQRNWLGTQVTRRKGEKTLEFPIWIDGA